MDTQSAVIQTENLTKTYRRGRKTILALDRLSLRVNKGEIFGYLGPNGAGKTTTIRLLLDLIRPTGGHASIFGQDVRNNSLAIHRRLGYLPGELNLWENITGRQTVEYIGSVRGGVDTKYVHELAERLGLDLSIKMRQYSTGNKRKLGIVLAMMNKPDLLILDEPTNGLDPLVQQTFYQLVREARDQGRTIFFSSHNLAEVQAICDRVAILRNGQLQAVESIEKMTHTDFKWVTLHFREAVPVGHLAGVPGVSDISVHNHSLRLRLHGDFDPLVRAVSDYYITDIITEAPSLEEIFLTFYGDKAPVQNGLTKETVK